MPIIKSAIKKASQDKKRTAANRIKKEKILDAIKTLIKAIDNKQDAAEITKALSLAYKRIDKGVKKNLIHKNTGARKKSRLARLVKATSGSKTTSEKKTKPAA